MIDLSIIIITLNNKKLLESCIDSIKEFTRHISYEVIVSDNGSTDGTIEMMKSRFPDVCLIENRKNLGFSAANNKGLKKANGRYCLVLNDDTFIEEDAFSIVIDYMDKNENAGAAGPRLLNIDGTVQKQGSIFSARKWSSKGPIDVDLVIGACLFIRTSVLDEIGYFDENLFFYNDDLDLCRRIRKTGRRIVYYPLASVYHYGGFSSKRSKDRTLQTEGVRGGLYFCKKHYGPIVYQAYRIIIIISAALMFLVSLIMYPFKAGDPSYYAGILRMALKQELIPKP